MSEQPVTFKAQIAPIQSGMMIGPDGLMVKIIPVELDGDLVKQLYGLQEQAFVITALDSMGDIRVNASIPDTSSAIAVNKKTPHIKILIPKVDALTGLRLYALYGRVFDLKVEMAANGKPKKEKKPQKPKGPNGMFWNVMHSVFNNLDLKEVLGVSGGNYNETKAALHAAFNVTSCTFISPEDFSAWAESKNLPALAHQAIVESRRLEASRAQEAEG